MADISNMYPPFCIPAILTIGGMYLFAILFRVFVGGGDSKEQNRVEMYSDLIAADSDLAAGRITQAEYNEIHDEFYHQHPNGDVSY